MPASVSEYVPQCSPVGRASRRALWVWVGTASVVASVVGLIFAAPWLVAGGHASWGRVVYAGFAPVCHQMPERSFAAWGLPLAVCARCAGMYAGFALGALGYPLVRPLGSRETPARAWLIAAAVPTAVDFALGFFGLWENTHLSRSLTGALLGAVAALYVVPGLVDLSFSRGAGLFRARAEGVE
jgi:uncharacterized membrane protein